MIRWNGITIDRKQRIVSHGGVCCSFAPNKFRLVEALICGRPSMPRELADRLWSDRIDGGPLGFATTIKVMFTQLRPPLAGIGLTIAKSGPWGHSMYWIEPAMIEQRKAA